MRLIYFLETLAELLPPVAHGVLKTVVALDESGYIAEGEREPLAYYYCVTLRLLIIDNLSPLDLASYPLVFTLLLVVAAAKGLTNSDEAAFLY